MSRQWCKHYRGMHEKEWCEAGVAFKELPGFGFQWFFDTCPCFGPNGSKCDKAEYPTQEEMAEREAERNSRFEKIRKAREAIVSHLGGPWRRGAPGANGRIDCPACGGKASLAFSRAGYNGHIHASCTTENCVSWME